MRGKVGPGIPALDELRRERGRERGEREREGEGERGEGGIGSERKRD